MFLPTTMLLESELPRSWAEGDVNLNIRVEEC